MFEKRRAAKAKEQRDTELREFVRTLPDADGVISQDGEVKFLRYLNQHGYADENGFARRNQMPPGVVSEFALGMANGGRFAEAEVRLHLKHGETGYLERPARLLTAVADREVSRRPARDQRSAGPRDPLPRRRRT